jgi:hypothetical protein
MLDITPHVDEDTPMTKTNHRGRGRGSNPASRQNLTGPMRDAFVYERGGGIGWSELAGPMTYHEASAHAAKLEAMNGSTMKPMYAATRGRA